MGWFSDLFLIFILCCFGILGFHCAFKPYNVKDDYDTFYEILEMFSILPTYIVELFLWICKKILPTKGYLIIYRTVAFSFGLIMFGLTLIFI